MVNKRGGRAWRVRWVKCLITVVVSVWESFVEKLDMIK